MRAFFVSRPGELRRTERDVPEPGTGQVLVRISCCGVCRTDLHLLDGDLPPRHPGITPGHEIVGRVEASGSGAERFAVGARVGVAWLGATDGSCRFCRRGAENLCLAPTFTGWDRNGGYADFCLADEAYAYPLPEGIGDEQVAPLLCAGIIGYRALRQADLRPGCRLGLYGFGSSAHIAIQVARHFGCRVYVMTRGERHQALARELGAAWAGPADAKPPEPLDSAVLFAPVGELVLPALEALDMGGTLAIAGIHLSDVPILNYQRHLFHEKTLRSVTTNTRRDGDELFKLAAEIPLQPKTTTFPLVDANLALRQLKRDAIAGSGVLEPS